MSYITCGFIGLGLIGGSIAKALKAFRRDVRILAFDTNKETLALALKEGIADEAVSSINERFSVCDYLFLCAPVSNNDKNLTAIKEILSPDCILTDVGSVKSTTFRCVEETGLSPYFIGGHPMAGSHLGGFVNARANLYHRAPMVLVPPRFDDIALLERAKALLAPAGFGRFSVTTAERHDEMIAFTSQLAHVVSNAYVKSPTAQAHKGFSAGSYKDLTRVAWLNAPMWAELFLENGDCLIRELDWLIGHLAEYRDAIAAGDCARLTQLLEDGKRRKEEIDG